jgi:hypothetical protein
MARKTKNQIHRERMDAIRAENQAIVATGVCPQCGTELKRNSAMAGWFQCGAFGEPYFRKPGHKKLPKCSFQCFTE